MAYQCECRCSHVIFAGRSGWVGCSSGVHCGNNNLGCRYPREK